MQQGLTYADVLIVPDYSDINSRDEIDIRTQYLGEWRLPFVSSPMDFVTGDTMAQAMVDLGAYGIVSRFGEKSDAYSGLYGRAVGAKDADASLDFIEEFRPHSICIDVAHGAHQNVVTLVERIKDTYPNIWVIAGNVATYYGAYMLASAGADAIRVGIGAGSACSTRENTGIGVPQLTAVIESAKIKETFPEVAIIADGGIQTPGDIAKALTAGADAVMLGNMLAGHDESPGEIITKDRLGEDGVWYGDLFKRYRGQSLLGSNGTRKAPEGVEGFVPYRGPLKDTIDTLSNYLKSSFSYVGARNIMEFQERASFVQVSPATAQESRTRL